MKNFAFESDMQKIRQAEDTGKVSPYDIARDTVHVYAKHHMLDGRTGKDFAHRLSFHPKVQAEIIEEFDKIIAQYKRTR